MFFLWPFIQSKLKKELKDWQKGFEARVGRPPNDADKSVIEDRFLAYQKVCFRNC